MDFGNACIEYWIFRCLICPKKRYYYGKLHLLSRFCYWTECSEASYIISFQTCISTLPGAKTVTTIYYQTLQWLSYFATWINNVSGFLQLHNRNSFTLQWKSRRKKKSFNLHEKRKEQKKEKHICFAYYFSP